MGENGMQDTPKGVVSLQLHGLVPLDADCQPTLDTLFKTFNSASRCAFKRFQEIGLNEMLKSHRKPDRRKFMSRFRDVPVVDGKPVCFDCPTGMSESTWRSMREESYRRKALKAWDSASPFWQVDRDLGRPIGGTEELVGDWASSHGYELDSVLLHNAVLSGFRNYKSFERQKSRFRTSKSRPCFGDIVGRSKKDITHGEFELTRNSSITVIGRRKVGNPKFKIDLEGSTLEFTFRRRRLKFSFKSHRFSKRGWKRLSDLVEAMGQGRLPVTITLVRTESGKYSASLAYSPSELEPRTKVRSNAVAGIWVNDEVVHHQIVQDGKVVHERTYKVDEFTRERKSRKLVECLKYSGSPDELARVRRNLANRRVAGTRDLLNKIFKISRDHGAGTVVVEAPRSKTRRNFDVGFISFDRYKVSNGIGAPCFMEQGRFLKMVQSQCARNGMALKKVNGAFIQLNAVLGSSSMSEAIRKATSEMVSRASEGQGICLAESAVQVIKSNPSMLDWVGHLLHNKRSRQARCEVRRAFKSRAAERAVRLLDKGQRRSAKGGCSAGSHPESVATS